MRHTFEGLGHLPGGGTFSTANAVSADRAVVVGSSHLPGGEQAFRHVGGVRTGLGHLPGGLGKVQLVTPVQIFTGFNKGGGYGVLTLDFVPEPSRLLALGVGAGAILLLGARQSRDAKVR